MSTSIHSSIEKKQVEVERLKAAKDNLQREFEELSTKLSIKYQPKEVVSFHIQRLKEYNELRDTGLKLTQLIAEEKSCKIKEVFDEMGYEMIDQ